MTPADAASAALILAGLAFILVANVGVLRLPDFYTRLHAQSKCDTLGVLLFLVGIALRVGWSQASAKILLILLFTAATAPTAAHALGRAALRSGLKPWTRPGGR